MANLDQICITIMDSMRTAPAGILPVIPLDRSADTPLYRQIYEGYRRAIAERRLRAGQRLPSTRSLAEELGVSRIPVLNAFEQLLAEGYVESRVGAGTFVARSLPGELTAPPRRAGARKPAARRARRPIARRAEAILQAALGPWLRGTAAFSVGQPPLDRFPLKLWSALVRREARRADPALLPYAPSLGLPALREAVAEYLRTARAVRCEADQIMIVSGSQQALELAANVLLDPGDPVWLEEPGYFGARKVLTLAGARVVPVPVDAAGLNVTVGVARCPEARAVFVTPSHQFPLGVTMSATRRLQLLDWARDSGAWIVEDDYDSEYRFGNLPIAALQGLDRDSRVLYVGTFTKVLFPALRLGYVVLPPDLVPAFVEVRRGMDNFSPPFPQAVLAEFIREGHFARHIRRTRLLCKERRAALTAGLARRLPELSILGDEAGMFLSAALPKGWRDREISARAAREGLLAPPLSESYLGPNPRQGLVLGYGGTGLPEIEAGVAHLARVVAARNARRAG
jgi:GntR family transcriptional regulator/MocR family aminotransferase